MGSVLKTYSDIEKRFDDLVRSRVESCGLTIYDLEYLPGSATLRLYIMNPQTGSAEIDDCSRVDHALTEAIEGAEWVSEHLVLEVSSPGVFRHLVSREHFRLACGQRVKWKLLEPLKVVAGEVEIPRNLINATLFLALLQEVDEQGVVVLIGERAVKIPYAKIKQAALEPELNYRERK